MKTEIMNPLIQMFPMMTFQWTIQMMKKTKRKKKGKKMIIHPPPPPPNKDKPTSDHTPEVKVIPREMIKRMMMTMMPPLELDLEDQLTGQS